MAEIKSEQDIRNIETESLKEKVLEFFKKENFDVTLSDLIKEFNMELQEVNLIHYVLEQLVEENFIKKSSSFDHFEYDPGEKLNHGGIQG